MYVIRKKRHIRIVMLYVAHKDNQIFLFLQVQNLNAYAKIINASGTWINNQMQLHSFALQNLTLRENIILDI
ncbi:MAG: hypothetical protein NDI94_02180 [Candidatus Woesearchaeota archaeon]|nr:hypothetical protein [Candidatus Woesearchaeota archaeon]